MACRQRRRDAANAAANNRKWCELLVCASVPQLLSTNGVVGIALWERETFLMSAESSDIRDLLRTAACSILRGCGRRPVA